MDENVKTFMSVTGASRGDAARFLQAAGGDAQEAIEAFYAEGPSAAEAGPSVAKSAARSRAPGGVRGLGDLQDDDEESEDDDHNDYYVGGEKSGQVVRGAPKAPEGPHGVDDLFEGAKRAGAQQGRPEDLHPSAGGGFQSFSGSGRTLAGSDVAPPPVAPGEAPAERVITIEFFRNGVFTVDGGEPRRMDDPANIPFMTAITRGQCPPELEPEDPSVHLAVNLVRRDTEYSPPAQPKYKAFAGTGRKLTDDSAPSTSAAAAAAAAPAPAAPAAVSAPPAGAPGGTLWEGADPAQPKTSIQLRLADGSRMVVEFNLSHTVGDIRRFIRASRPDLPTAYRLLTAFPSAQLEEDAATIADAGLANSVVIQKT